MATGIVRVSPGMLETKVMVAPNSPRLRAKASTTPTRIPGVISGSVIVMKASKRRAPSVRAAASSRRSTASSDSRMARTISGKAITAAARAAPFQVKMMVMPKVSYSQPPIGPRRPNSTSNRKPTTTGGTTSGRCTRPSRSTRPGKRVRASSQATAMATGRLQATLQNATRRLSRIASSSRSVGCSTRADDREAVVEEHAARLWPAQIIIERARGRVILPRDQRDRVDDLGVAGLRELVDDADLLADHGVRCIDHAGGRFAALDEGQGRPHVFGAYHR